MWGFAPAGMGSWRRLAALCAVLAVPAGAEAQGAPGAATVCNNEVVAAVTVRTVRMSDRRAPGALERAGDWLRQISPSTSWDVVRRYLLIREGQRCSEHARRESERVLRAQPFLADARIYVAHVATDTIQLDIVTADEIAINVGMDIRQNTVSGLRLGNSNILGRAVTATVLYERGFAYRDGFGVRFSDYQAFGNRWVLSGAAVRDPLGSERSASIRAPLYTELRPRAWYAGGGTRHVFHSLQRRGGRNVAIELRQTQWLTGIAWRLGRPQRAVLLGPLAEGEHVTGDGAPVVVTDTGIVPYTGNGDLSRDYGFRSVRIGGMAAVRRTVYVPVRGFDAIAGPQDLRDGFDAVLVAAHSVGSRNGADRADAPSAPQGHDVVLGTSLYAGAANDARLVAAQVDAEAAREYERGRWMGVLVSGRAAWYHQPVLTRLHTVSVEYGGAWRARVPLQMTLSDKRAGLRGFGTARVGGGSRIVARTDHRWTLPPPWERADAAVALFGEVGRLWAGDAPFGENTSWQASVGASLLAAAPRGSKRVWRLDLAFPLTRAGSPRRAELRATVGDFTLGFGREPTAMQRARGGLLLPRALEPQ